MKPRTGFIKRSAAPKKRNPKRRKSEFARTYHSKARVAFVKSLGCVLCTAISPLFGWFTEGKCHNAHTETGGMGRKADYTTIVPLCPAHHQQYDDHLSICDLASVRELVKNAAPEIERRWWVESLKPARRRVG